MNVLNTLNSLSRSRIYWLSYIVGSVALLAAALYFQFVLEELPCLLCIQVRLLITLLLLVSVVGLTTLKYRVINIMTHLATVLIAGGLAERSYQLLGTERGFVFGDCGFNLGLPAWFAIEEWLPWLYRVETSCGYTPEILFGITMAEALMAMSVLLCIACISLFFASFFYIKPQE